MDNLLSCDFFDWKQPLNGVPCELSDAIRERREEDVLTLLERLDTPLSDSPTAWCLKETLHCSPALFRRVLERCRPGEYAWRITCQDPVTEANISVNGTILTLAAALDLPEHVRILLDAGYDVNSAGLESGKAFGASRHSLLFPVRYCGNGSSWICSQDHRWAGIFGVTPLAAAIVCGSRRAAEVLLEHPDVWKRESSAVCRAAAMVLQPTRRQGQKTVHNSRDKQEVVRMVFCPEQEGGLDPAALLSGQDLQPYCFIDICTADDLRLQLEGGFCTEEDARLILKQLDREDDFFTKAPPVLHRGRKLALMKKHFPHVCREPWAAGVFLRDLLHRYTPEHTCPNLMRRWKELCNGEGDLTWGWGRLSGMQQKTLRQFLLEAGKDMELVIDADAIRLQFKAEITLFTELIRHVRLRFNHGLEGISGLTASLLSWGDLRAVQAARQGILAQESASELLSSLRYMEQGAALRPLVLAYGGKGSQEPEDAYPRWAQRERYQRWSREWNVDEKTFLRWMEELFSEDLSERECLRRLIMAKQKEQDIGVFGVGMVTGNVTVRHPRRGEVRFSKVLAGLCCGQATQPLTTLLRYMPEQLNDFVRVSFDRGPLQVLWGTPLCIAAATGQTEKVKLLLDAGIHPDELGKDVVSYCCYDEDVDEDPDNPLFLTPVLAAILFGEEETARLMLNAGAVCDFSRPRHREILTYGDTQTYELAKRLPGVGLEKMPPEVRGMLDSWF